MMFLALILAAATTATPAPPSLASLRVIANVRSTPVCSAMRLRVGPAIAALLENDATLDQAPPMFHKMYRDALLTPSAGPGNPNSEYFLNLGSLETLIGPLVKNLKTIDDLLADKTFDDPRLAPVKRQLESVEAQQKAALNVVSGYDGTALTYNMLLFDSSIPAASQPSSRIARQFDSGAFFSSAEPSRFQGPRTAPGRFDVSLAYNPFRPFAQAIVDMRTRGADAESGAAASIAPVVAACRI